MFATFVEDLAIFVFFVALMADLHFQFLTVVNIQFKQLRPPFGVADRALHRGLRLHAHALGFRSLHLLIEFCVKETLKQSVLFKGSGGLPIVCDYTHNGAGSGPRTHPPRPIVHMLYLYDR